MISVALNINTEILNKLEQSCSSLPEKVLKQWSFRYRAFAQDRFDRFSKGGGNWAPLAKSTIYHRRHGGAGGFKRGKKAYEAAVAGGGGQISILRDTGLLFNTLDPKLKQPGLYEMPGLNKITIGFSDGIKHTGGSASIADIANYHQSGGKYLPKREILVEPDQDTCDGMSSDVSRYLETLQ